MVRAQEVSTEHQVSTERQVSTAHQVSGLVRRVRRELDLSQRDLAERLGTSSSTEARAESEGRISVDLLCRVLALAGCRLAGAHEDGTLLAPMRHDAPRNRGGRRYPAHLDAQFPFFRTPHLAAWFLGHGWGRNEPILTFRRRPLRDEFRHDIPPRPDGAYDPSSFPHGRPITVADDHPSDRDLLYWREPWRTTWDELEERRQRSRLELAQEAAQAAERRRAAGHGHEG